MMKRSASDSHHFARHWDLYIIFAFLIARTVLNIQEGMLAVFFAVMYVLFLIMLARKVRFFSTLFVLFLTLDSMITVYFASILGFNTLYYWVLGLNFAMIALVVQNVHKDFPR